METLYNDLRVTVFHEPQPNRCNYKYIITNGAFAHIAFRRKASFKRWLNERGLKLGRKGWRFRGQRTFEIEGSYKNLMMMDCEAFDRLTAPTSKVMSNGSWTLCKILQDDDCIKIVYLNPNVNRAIFDRRTEEAHG
jgi:hypothetical protein